MRADEAIDVGGGPARAKIVRAEMNSQAIYASVCGSGLLKWIDGNGDSLNPVTFNSILRDDWEVYQPTPKPKPCEACMSLSEVENLMSSFMRPRWSDTDFFTPGSMTEVKSIETADEEIDKLIITHGLMVVCKALGPLLKQACTCDKEAKKA